MPFQRSSRSRVRRRPRILLYSHDTFGLGHLRRSLLIAGALARAQEPPDILVATGSPRPEALALPPGCDYLKLPCLTKAPDGTYRPRNLDMSLRDVIGLRANLILAAAQSFRPDLILVDHAPVGAEGELWPLFEKLARRPGPRLVVGLRDVIDEAERVRLEWNRLGVWSFLRDACDRVLVYGDPDVLTTAQELNLPERLPGKVRFVGYMARSIVRARVTGNEPDRVILVTAGGGGDGENVFRSYAECLRRLPRPVPVRSLVVTGPFLSPGVRAEVIDTLRMHNGRSEIVSFVDGLERLLPWASGAVSMAGYNTVMELLSARVPALLMPRTEPRKEQLLRAMRLSEVSDLEVCEPTSPGVETISRFLAEVLTGPPQPRTPQVRLNGVARTSEELLRMARLEDDPDDAWPVRSMTPSDTAAPVDRSLSPARAGPP